MLFGLETDHKTNKWTFVCPVLTYTNLQFLQRIQQPSAEVLWSDFKWSAR